MTRRIVAIAFIYCCASVAWVILGASLLVRSQSADSLLGGRVASTWGAAQTQRPPSACAAPERPAPTTAAPGVPPDAAGESPRAGDAAPLERSRVEVRLGLTPRRKGLLWYNTYTVDYRGVYTFRNPADRERDICFTVPFPAENSIYDDLTLALDGAPLAWRARQGAAAATARVGPGRAAVLTVSHRSQGLDRWSYEFGGATSLVRDFRLTVNTDFSAMDFPENTLSPTAKQARASGWELVWSYRSLVTGRAIVVQMPERLQPGPLAARISLFAPVSLLFFFFVLFVITELRRIELHPVNFFFLATAFFSFHLLLAYLVDLAPLHLAFAICSVVSVFLVVSYLRLVAGLRFAALEAGVAQLIYLVLFSYAFFWSGLTGLTITIGAIITLFVVMQLTGRIRWAERFSPRRA